MSEETTSQTPPVPPPPEAPPSLPQPGVGTLRTIISLSKIGKDPVGGSAGPRVAARRKPLRVFASTAEEIDPINTALDEAGMTFTVENDEDLQRAKKAAGLGSTKSPSADFDGFAKRLIAALKLGALDGVDADEGVQQEFANEFKEHVKRAVPARKERLKNTVFTFEDCERIAEAVTEEVIYGLTPLALARKVKDHVGGGSLAGLFPGESGETTAAEGGEDRLDKMNEFGRHIVELLRGAGAVKPELTGSIVLKGGGYGGIPEDLDVNVTTSGSENERQEQWDAVLDIMNGFDGLRVTDRGGPIYIFAMKPGKIQGENARIWERRYGYPIAVEGETKKRVMPFEVEVKDVGGDVWKEQLKPDAPARTTDEEGVSEPQWLLVDTMTRILGHKKNMIESVSEPNPDLLEGVPKDEQAARWLTMVQDEGVEKSQGKLLWEKLNVAYKMSMAQQEWDHDDLSNWLQKVVKDTKAFGELLALAGNENSYESWLRKIA